MDGAVTIKDATAIQRYIAGKEEFNNMQWYLADYNCNGEIAISDVTAIQQYLVAKSMVE